MSTATTTTAQSSKANSAAGDIARIFPLFPLLLGLPATSAHAASFDCKLARGKIDTMICADSALSKLDGQLAVVYAQFRQTSGDERAVKAGQLAWLKSRNACADLACVKRTYETRIAELQARSASASPIAGFWKLEYSCAKATGIYEERCRQGEREGKTATVRFHSAWGGTGTAGLRVDGNTLHWKVSAKDEGESWIPDQAELARIPAGQHDRMPACGG